ncbi:hypothetical protein BZA70DRAFT_288032 [Myxozyma melibiosi]|uniref:Transmembrane protein n=1 Tax=Myxozyma melibiosi TaxID=54550 RepID=A0ABR1F9N8_9ASCO
MRSTPIDRAISAHSGTLLLSFTGIVVAAFSYMTLFGDSLPKYARGIEPVLPESNDEQEGEQEVDDEGSEHRKKLKKKRKAHKKKEEAEASVRVMRDAL